MSGEKDYLIKRLTETLNEKKKKVRKSRNTQEIAKLDGLKEEVQDIQKQI